MFKKNKVTFIGNPENSYAAFEEHQKLINLRRDVATESLVQNTYEKLSLKYLLRPIGGLFLGVFVVVLGLVLMPQHDVVAEPEYWWECLVLQCNVIWINMAGAFFIFTANSLLNMDGIFKIKHYIATWLLGAAFYTFSWLSTYAIWVHLLGFRYPLPFVGIINAVLGLASQVLAVWFLFPKAWSKLPAIKTRHKWLVVFYVVVINLSICYWIMWWVFINVPSDYQWIMALWLPIFREITGHFLSFLGC